MILIGLALVLAVLPVAARADEEWDRCAGAASGADCRRRTAPLIQLSFFLFCVNRVPVILIGFRNRFLALAPAITRG